MYNMDKCCSCKTDGIIRCICCEVIVKSKCECEIKKPYIKLRGGNKNIYICIECFNKH